MSSFYATATAQAQKSGLGKWLEIRATHTLKIMWLMGATCLEIARGTAEMSRIGDTCSAEKWENHGDGVQCGALCQLSLNVIFKPVSACVP